MMDKEEDQIKYRTRLIAREVITSLLCGILNNDISPRECRQILRGDDWFEDWLWFEEWFFQDKTRSEKVKALAHPFNPLGDVIHDIWLEIKQELKYSMWA